MLYGALGVGAGVLGGMFIAHEAGEVEQHFEQDKYRVEQDAQAAEYDVANAPDAIAGWAGQKVGDAEYDVDRVKYDVEDFPEVSRPWECWVSRLLR